DVNELRCDDEELRGHIHVELFHQMKILEVLFCNFRNRDVVDVQLLPAYQVQEQIERPFIRRQRDFEIVEHESLNLHRLSNFKHGLTSGILRLLRTFAEDVSHVARMSL